MREFLSSFFDKIKQIFSKLTLNQKLILFGLVFVLLIAFIYVIKLSSDRGTVLLYPAGLKKTDFERAKSKLTTLKINYTTSDGRYIYVNNEEIAIKARAQLGIEGVVRDVNGFELFNNPEFSTTDFERRVNLRRAITGNLIRHLEALDDIDKAEVTISFGENTRSIYLRDQESNPLTASVSIKPAPFSDLRENKNKIRGLRAFIAKGVDRLNPENVIIIEQSSGLVLTDKIDSTEDDANIARASEQLRIKEKIRFSKIKELRTLLSMFPEDRYQLSVDVDINWDVKNTVIQGIEPVILKNPHDPFDKGVVSDGVIVSEQEVKENFDGPSYIPEGPAGVEPNVAPGAKELVDRYTQYKRTTTTKNKEMATKIQEKKDQPYQIMGFHVAVAVDGLWKKLRDEDGKIKFDKSGRIKREYIKVSNAEIKELQKLVKAAFSKKRGDIVEVRHFQFDRFKEFEKENEEFRSSRERDKYLFIGIVSFAGIILLIIFYQLIKNEINRRRRLREEQIVREQKAMREAALLAAEEEGVVLDIPPEDRARLEMQENAINLAREKPEDVAQLIRTWIVEE